MIKDFDISRQIPAKELVTLLKVSSALATSLDLSVVLQTAIESATEVLGLETGAIYILQDPWMVLGATTPPLDLDLQKQLLKPEFLHHHPHLNQSLTLKEPVYITDANKADLSPAETAIRDSRQLKTILFIPLILKEKAVGAMIVGSTRKIREFADDEIVLCKVLSYQIAMAVANAQLYQSMQKAHSELIQAYDVTLQGWALALEMRDLETYGHTLRVTHMTEELSRRAEVTEPTLINIRRGALLHDIGKISVPDHILKKIEPLSEEEWAILRRHPEFAHQFLAQVAYLLPSLDIPYCHHEKWDGTGYPQRLKGEEIPLAARIFAVVDVYDALTSDRPYRSAWQKETALHYIREQSGKHFDPRIVAMFLQMIEEKG